MSTSYDSRSTGSAQRSDKRRKNPGFITTLSSLLRASIASGSFLDADRPCEDGEPSAGHPRPTHAPATTLRPAAGTMSRAEIRGAGAGIDRSPEPPPLRVRGSRTTRCRSVSSFSAQKLDNTPAPPTAPCVARSTLRPAVIPFRADCPSRNHREME